MNEEARFVEQIKQQHISDKSDTGPAPEKVVETPTVDTDDAFMQAAAYVDRGEDIPDDLLVKTGAKAEGETLKAEETDAKAEPEAPKAEQDNKRPRDESGKFVAKSADDPIKPVDASTTAPESEFAKKQREQKEKDEARKEKTWQNINKKREELDERERKIESERQEFLKQKSAPAKPQFSSARLWDAHLDFSARANEALKKYREDGDITHLDEHDKLVGQAQAANKSANDIYAEEQKINQAQRLTKRDQAWKEAIETVLPSEPDLLDNGTPLAKEVIALLGSPVDPKNPKVAMVELFKSMPNGFSHAVQVAKWKMGYDQKQMAEEALGKERAERERLEKLTAISGGGTTATAASKTFDKMSKPEQDAWIMRQAQEYDRQNGIY